MWEEELFDDLYFGARDAKKAIGNWAKNAHPIDAVASAVSTVEQGVSDFGAGFHEEGILSAIGDPRGVIDRQDAKRDLADNFEVLPDDFIGPRNHNQVSQDEFDHIAHTYSDIRLGRGELTINTDGFDTRDDANRYRDAAMEDVAQMMMTTSGRRQIEQANDNEEDYHTTINPYFQSSDDKTFAGLSGDDHAEPWAAQEGRVYYKPVRDDSDVALAHELEHIRHFREHTRAEGTYTEPYVDDLGDATTLDVQNEERNTVGLTHNDPAHPLDPDGCSENQYRFERNQLGDHWVPRTTYGGAFPQQERDENKLAAQWKAFMGSASDALFG